MFYHDIHGTPLLVATMFYEKNINKAQHLETIGLSACILLRNAASIFPDSKSIYRGQRLQSTTTSKYISEDSLTNHYVRKITLT